MKNDTRPFIKIRNHIFYYDKSYAMHNGGIVDMVVTYNADGNVSQMTMDDFIKQKGTKLVLRNGLTAVVSHVMPKDSISPYPITGYIEGSENMPLTWAMNGQNFISQPSNFDVVEIKE